MVRKGYPILKRRFFALIILSFFISCFIMLFCPNAIAQMVTDDYLEDRNGFENDNYRNAVAISPGEYQNLICRDDDWYKVNVPDLGEIITANLKVSIQFSHMNGDLTLVLYSTKASPNDYNFLEISGLTANEEIVSASVPPGDYLINVHGYPGVNNNYTMNMEILYPCQYFPYEWIDISNEGQAIQMEDDDSKEIEIGFDFKFYDHVYKKVKVSSNGYLTFAEPTLPYFNPSSPTPIRANHRNAPPISIFSYWMDLRPDLGGGVFYKIDDQSNPNCKKLIVEWRDIPKDSAGGGITFQAVLFECTNQILLQYKDVIFSSQNDGYSLGSGATIGITNGRKTENSIDRIATQYLYKNQGVTERTAVMFTPSLNDPLEILSSNLIGEEIQILSPEEQINILFSQYIDVNTLDGSLLIDPYINGEWLINQSRITFKHPEDTFENSLNYMVTLYSGQIKNCFGKPLFGDADYIFTFTANETDANQPSIEVSPISLAFDDVVVNEASDPMEMVIFNRGNANLNIKGLILSEEMNFSINLNGGPNPIGNLPVTIPSGDNRSLTITFTPDSKNEFDALLDIISNDPNNPSIAINLYGEGIPQTEPDIQVSPTSLNFENISTKNSSTLFINISNKGNAVLNILNLTFQNQNTANFPFDFTGDPNPIENLPVSIPANGGRTISITFTPSIEGTFTTELEIISDDPDTPQIYVSIKGTGLSIPRFNCLEPYDCFANTNITTLMIDTNENLWIGTGEGGICEYNLYTGTFLCFNQDDGLAGNNVADIAVGPQGEIWIATNPDIYGNTAGVSQFIDSTEGFISYDPSQMGTDDDIDISDITVDNKGHLWVAADSELLEFDGFSWNSDYSIGSYITSLDVDSNGRLWIGTDFLGIYVKEPFDVPRSVDLNSGLIYNISEIFIDPNGFLWMVSLLNNENSLLFSSPDELISYDQDGLMPESLPLPDSLVKTDHYTAINDLFIHPVTGNLFLASDNGFFMYDGEIWHHFNIANSYNIPSPYVNSIIVDPYNDYWIATEEGLSHFNSAAPYIVGKVCGEDGEDDNTTDLPINTNILVTFSEPMDQSSTEDSFQMISKDESGSIVNGTFYWNKNSTVIKFEPASSLAYNSKYEISISKDAKDRAGMTIDMNVCGGTNYCIYTVSTTYKDVSEEESSTDPYTKYTGFFNYYRSNYNYNSSYWSGYSVNNFKSPYWSGQSIGNSLLKIPSNNFNLQYSFNRYSNYQSIGIPQIQSFPFPNFNSRNLFSTFNYKNYTNYNNYYTKNIYRTFENPLQGFNNYSRFYQNR